MTIVKDYTALLNGTSASAEPGKGAFYTYSFSTKPPSYLSEFFTAAELATFTSFSNAEKNLARTALKAWASISGITLFEVSKGVGDINFSKYDFTKSLFTIEFSGYAYPPSIGSIYGFTNDVFINNKYTTSLHLLLHEIGHALGLKHSFDGPVTLDPALDDFAHTVMSYTPSGSDGTKLGPLDVAAIQYLYGTNANDGKQIASWKWNPKTETLTQIGGGADDVIGGVAARDVIHGGAGNDTITGGTGGDTIFGDSGNDTISALFAPGYGAVSINGGDGSDTLSISADIKIIATTSGVIHGGAGNDFIDGWSGSALYGDAGNDTIVASTTSEHEGIIVDGGKGDDSLTVATDVKDPSFAINGGAGVDSLTVNSAGGQTAIDIDLSGGSAKQQLIGIETFNVNGSPFADQITGSSNGDTIEGFGGADVIQGMAGDDTIYEEVKSATTAFAIDAGTGNDLVQLRLAASGPKYLGAQTLMGGDGGDTLFIVCDSSAAATFSLARSFKAGLVMTSFESVVIFGGSADDRLVGSNGSEFLSGGDGNDWLFGGNGRDVLQGGNGADTFVFRSGVSSALQANVTVINDFSHSQGDRIDLSGIDADRTQAGDQSFTFIGTDAFTAPGQLRLENGYVEGDTNGDGKADFSIGLYGAPVSASDFVL